MRSSVDQPVRKGNPHRHPSDSPSRAFNPGRAAAAPGRRRSGGVGGGDSGEKRGREWIATTIAVGILKQCYIKTLAECEGFFLYIPRKYRVRKKSRFAGRVTAGLPGI